MPRAYFYLRREKRPSRHARPLARLQRPSYRTWRHYDANAVTEPNVCTNSRQNSRVHTLASKCNSRIMDSSPLVTHTRQLFARGEEVCAPFEVSLAPLASGLMSAPRSSADGVGRRAARPSGTPAEVRRARFPVEIIPNSLSHEHRERSPSPKPQKYVFVQHSPALYPRA